jgi:hypothetical protein
LGSAARRGVGGFGGGDLAGLHQLLEAAQFAAGLNLRLLLEQLGDQLAEVAAGRVVDDGGGDLGAAAGRGVLELDAAGVLDVGALGRLPGDQLGARPR